MIEQAQDIASAYDTLGSLSIAVVCAVGWALERREKQAVIKKLDRFLGVVESKDDSTK
ncbi:MAG: hypothetical protein KDC38_19985 [Planctomycetes bacterium]|nr:hypothetical protein [Planctomycetota bacterium]